MSKITVKQLESEMTKANKIADNMAKQGDQLGTIVKRWLDMGKIGQKAVIAFCEHQKEQGNELALACVNQACKRFFKAHKMDLSLKGIGIKTENGRKQPVEISPKTKNDNSGGGKGDKDDKGAEKGAKVVFDDEKFDALFITWATDQQNAFIDHLTALRDKTTKERTK